MSRSTARYLLLLALVVVLFYWKLTNRFTLILGSPPLYDEYLALTQLLCAWFMFTLLRELRRGLLRALRAQRRDRMAFFGMQALFVATAGVFYAAVGQDGILRADWKSALVILVIPMAVAGGPGAARLLPGNWGNFPAGVLTAFSPLGGRDDLLNTRYFIKTASTPDPGSIYRDANWKVYENPQACRRAWIVRRVAAKPSHDAVFRRLGQIDLREIALVEKRLPQSPIPADGANESVRFLPYEADSIVIEANAASAGLLVLSEMYHPGWRAAVNGKGAEIYPVDGALRGIAAAGPNRVELEYAPFSLRAGAALSVPTLFSVLAGWLYINRRFRAQS